MIKFITCDQKKQNMNIEHATSNQKQAHINTTYSNDKNKTMQHNQESNPKFIHIYIQYKYKDLSLIKTH